MILSIGIRINFISCIVFINLKFYFMKKITLLSFFIGGFLFAQQPQSYAELSNLNQTNESTGEVATVISNGTQGIIDTYVAKALFDLALADNCSDPTVTFEDFLGGPTGITECGLTMSSAGDGCYAAGELEEGFVISASNGSATVSIPAGAIGNTDPLAGAMTFLEFTAVDFDPNVYAVAFDIWENNSPMTDIRVFGEGGALIETITTEIPVGIQVFFGLIADEPISRVEIEGELESGELIGNFYFGATCEALSINDNALSQLSVYPNPSSDVININTPSSVEIISTELYDVLGNVVLRGATNQLNVSSLSTGMYLLNITTNQGSISKKVFRK